MIVLYTDFGTDGPYVGQVKTVLAESAPGVPVIGLMHDAPAFDPKPAAYLLAALAARLPRACVVLGVVDPGVGGARDAVIVEADERFYVGPGNGLFEIVARRSDTARWWRITAAPPGVSASFHGRDLFAPVAARLAAGERPARDIAAQPLSGGDRTGRDWPDDLAEIIYIDGYGNAMTGIRAAAHGDGPLDVVAADGPRRLEMVRTFSDVPPGAPLVYINSQGLVEIAVNQGRADDFLGLGVGSPVAPVTG